MLAVSRVTVTPVVSRLRAPVKISTLSFVARVWAVLVTVTVLPVRVNVPAAPLTMVPEAVLV